jgi:hypothetical protein
MNAAMCETVHGALRTMCTALAALQVAHKALCEVLPQRAASTSSFLASSAESTSSSISGKQRPAVDTESASSAPSAALSAPSAPLSAALAAPSASPATSHRAERSAAGKGNWSSRQRTRRMIEDLTVRGWQQEAARRREDARREAERRDRESKAERYRHRGPAPGASLPPDKSGRSLAHGELAPGSYPTPVPRPSLLSPQQRAQVDQTEADCKEMQERMQRYIHKLSQKPHSTKKNKAPPALLQVPKPNGQPPASSSPSGGPAAPQGAAPARALAQDPQSLAVAPPQQVEGGESEAQSPPHALPQPHVEQTLAAEAPPPPPPSPSAAAPREPPAAPQGAAPARALAQDPQSLAVAPPQQVEGGESEAQSPPHALPQPHVEQTVVLPPPPPPSSSAAAPGDPSASQGASPARPPSDVEGFLDPRCAGVTLGGGAPPVGIKQTLHDRGGGSGGSGAGGAPAKKVKAEIPGSKPGGGGGGGGGDGGDGGGGGGEGGGDGAGQTAEPAPLCALPEAHTRKTTLNALIAWYREYLCKNVQLPGEAATACADEVGRVLSELPLALAPVRVAAYEAITVCLLGLVRELPAARSPFAAHATLTPRVDHRPATRASESGPSPFATWPHWRSVISALVNPPLTGHHPSLPPEGWQELTTGVALRQMANIVVFRLLNLDYNPHTDSAVNLEARVKLLVADAISDCRGLWPLEDRLRLPNGLFPETMEVLGLDKRAVERMIYQDLVENDICQSFLGLYFRQTPKDMDFVIERLVDALALQTGAQVSEENKRKLKDMALVSHAAFAALERLYECVNPAPTDLLSPPFCSFFPFAPSPLLQAFVTSGGPTSLTHVVRQVQQLLEREEGGKELAAALTVVSERLAAATAALEPEGGGGGEVGIRAAFAQLHEAARRLLLLLRQPVDRFTRRVGQLVSGARSGLEHAQLEWEEHLRDGAREAAGDAVSAGFIGRLFAGGRERVRPVLQAAAEAAAAAAARGSDAQQVEADAAAAAHVEVQRLVVPAAPGAAVAEGAPRKGLITPADAASLAARAAARGAVAAVEEAGGTQVFRVYHQLTVAASEHGGAEDDYVPLGAAADLVAALHAALRGILAAATDLRIKPPPLALTQPPPPAAAMAGELSDLWQCLLSDLTPLRSLLSRLRHAGPALRADETEEGMWGGRVQMRRHAALDLKGQDAQDTPWVFALELVLLRHELSRISDSLHVRCAALKKKRPVRSGGGASGGAGRDPATAAAAAAPAPAAEEEGVLLRRSNSSSSSAVSTSERRRAQARDRELAMAALRKGVPPGPPAPPPPPPPPPPPGAPLPPPPVPLLWASFPPLTLSDVYVELDSARPGWARVMAEDGAVLCQMGTYVVAGQAAAQPPAGALMVESASLANGGLYGKGLQGVYRLTLPSREVLSHDLGLQSFVRRGVITEETSSALQQLRQLHDLLQERQELHQWSADLIARVQLSTGAPRLANGLEPLLTTGTKRTTFTLTHIALRGAAPGGDGVGPSPPWPLSPESGPIDRVESGPGASGHRNVRQRRGEKIKNPRFMLMFV